MKNNVYFRYKEHPGDLFRSTELIKLPDPDEDLESFLIQFLNNYQSDKRIAHLNDLYKLEDEQFNDETLKSGSSNNLKYQSDQEIKREILLLKNKLIHEAFENFYHLILLKKIDLVTNINNA